jgi:polar amino acid transport system substrate-binding protein
LAKFKVRVAKTDNSLGLSRLIGLLVFMIGMLLMPGRPVAAGIDDLDFLTEDFAPFNFVKDDKIQGISVDLLAEIFLRTGSAKTRKDIKVLPWTTGYRTTKRKKNTVLFSTLRTDTREDLFKWVGPVLSGDSVVIAKKSSNIRIRNIADLNHYIIGVVRDDASEQILLQAGVGPNRLYRTVSGTGGSNLGKMLAANRIDLLAYGKITAFWNFGESGFSTADYEVVYTLQKSDVYFALNKDTDDEIVTQMQTALEEIRASGRLDTIIRSYLPGFFLQP